METNHCNNKIAKEYRAESVRILPPPPISEAFQSVVATPWAYRCSGSEYPWIADSHLLNVWEKALESADFQTSISAAFGIMRAVGVQPKLWKTAFNVLSASPCDPYQSVRFLLTGGSPPFASGDVIGGEIYKKNFTTDIIETFYLAARHPCSHMWASKGFFPVWRPAIAFFCPNAKRPAFPTLWWRAVSNWQAFRGGGGGVLSDFVDYLSFSRTTAFGKKTKVADFFCDLGEEQVSPNDIESFHHSCPTKEAIDFFSNENSVACEIWRYYNPLLSLPWHFSHPRPPKTEIVFFLYALAGAPLFFAKRPKEPLLAKAWLEHPELSVVKESERLQAATEH